MKIDRNKMFGNFQGLIVGENVWNRLRNIVKEKKLGYYEAKSFCWGTPMIIDKFDKDTIVGVGPAAVRLVDTLEKILNNKES